MLLPKSLLRVEGAVLLALCLYAYAAVHASWWLFAVLILAPDLFMLGYLISPRIGALVYNVVHTSAVPVLLGLGGYVTHHPLVLAVSLIWLAHIEMDRMLGFGLKYPTAFQDTHLQHI